MYLLFPVGCIGIKRPNIIIMQTIRHWNVLVHGFLDCVAKVSIRDEDY